MTSGTIEECLKAIESAPSDGSLYVRLGKLYQARGLWTEAAASFRGAIAADPGNANLYAELASIQTRLGDFAAADVVLRDALRLEPRGEAAENVQFRIGELRRRQGRVAEAARAFRQMLAENPRNALARLELSRALKHEGRFADATAELEAALQGDMSEDVALAVRLELGELSRRLGRLEAAERHLREALDRALPPENAECARLELAEVCARLGRPEAAERALREAVAAAPESPRMEEMLFRLGQALAEQGRLDESIDTFQRLVGRNARHPLGRLELARAFKRKGDLAGTIEQLERALEAGLQGAVARTVRLELGEAYTRARRPVEAKAALGQVLGDEAPKEVAAQAFFRLGELALLEGDLAAGRSAFEQVLRLEPGHSIAHLDLGRLLKGAGDRQAAERHLREALRGALEPAAEEGGKLELADLLAQEGRHAEAETLLREVSASSPGADRRRNATFRLAECVRAQGRQDEAVAIFRAILAEDPQHALTKVELARWHKDKAAYAEAERLLDEAIAAGLSAEAEKGARLELAMLYRQMGRPASDSRREYERVSELNPSDESLPAWLRDLQDVKGFRKELAPYRAQFTWHIFASCNYSCSYCSAPTTPDRREERDQGKTLPPERWIAIWKGVHDVYGPCRIRLTGGEPSLYPGFYRLVSGVSEWHIVQMNTNLSFDVERFAREMNPKRVRIDASFHPEFPKLAAFLDKLRFLRSKGFRLIVSVVARPDFMEHLDTFKRGVTELGCDFLVHPFYGPFEGKEYPHAYTESERQRLYGVHEASRVNLEWQVEQAETTKGRECRMGQMYATIYANGDAYRCCNQDYRLQLGNLVDGTFKLLDEPVRCEASACQCWKSMVVEEEKRWAWQWVDEWEVYTDSNPLVPRTQVMPARGPR